MRRFVCLSSGQTCLSSTHQVLTISCSSVLTVSIDAVLCCVRGCVCAAWWCCSGLKSDILLPSLTQEEAAWAQVSLGGAALREARAELAEARKQWHSLQVEIETLHALVRTHHHHHPATPSCHSAVNESLVLFSCPQNKQVNRGQVGHVHAPN